MKTIKFLSILTILVSFSQCASVKFDEHPPFEITSAVYENWIGGQPGVSGINVKIHFSSNRVIEFDRIYFRNKVTKLRPRKAKLAKLIIGYFNTSIRQNDLVLDENPTKEMNNPIPELEKFPFKLKQNQAVISYKINEKIKYYKIKSLEKATYKNPK